MSEAGFATMTPWEYRDTAVPPPAPPLAKSLEPPAVALPPGLTEEQVLARVRAAVQEVEQRCAAEAAAREAQRMAQLQGSFQAFGLERERYFREAEREVVQLALAVARKILQREAALDPELLAALVRIALERMAAGSAVRLRVAPAEASRWQQGQPGGAEERVWEVVPDAGVAVGECRVETDLGSANFGFEVQLKEIERGMLDLLAARPHRTGAAGADVPGSEQAGAPGESR